MKVELCTAAFGYDVAIDYKEPRLAEALAAACPRGVNVYFDNTSGPISDTVMTQLALNARVVICGTASIANWDPPPMGPRVERHLLVKRAQMGGFIVFDYQHRYEEAVTQLAAWIREGRLSYREDIGRHRRLSGCHRRAFIARREPRAMRLVQLHIVIQSADDFSSNCRSRS